MLNMISPSMKPKLYTTHHKDSVKRMVRQKMNIGKYILVQFSGGQSQMEFMQNNVQYHKSLIQIETINHS
jgi:hypothetical protein